MSNKLDTAFVVCALADAEFAARGSRVGGIFCSVRFSELMIAPTGQKFLEEHPKARVICVECVPSDDEIDFLGFTAPLETILQEMTTMVPNAGRGRKPN